MGKKKLKPGDVPVHYEWSDIEDGHSMRYYGRVQTVDEAIGRNIGWSIVGGLMGAILGPIGSAVGAAIGYGASNSLSIESPDTIDKAESDRLKQRDADSGGGYIDISNPGPPRRSWE